MSQAAIALGKIGAIAICKIGTKTNDEILARAKVAATIAGFFTAASKGDMTAVNQQVQTAIGNISDPGLNQVATQLWQVGEPIVSAELTVVENAPVLGDTLEGNFAGIGQGMAEVAGAYITKYSTSPATTDKK